jgi:hypothetical protein
VVRVVSGLILDGRVVPVPGVDVHSYLDDDRIPEATDGYRLRRRPVGPKRDAADGPWIRAIVLHTVHGKRGGTLRAGLGPPSQRDVWYAQYQARTPRDVSWDYTVDTDGSVAVSNDPLRRASWHAGGVNRLTIGIELVQESDGSLWMGQLDVLVRVLDVLTRELRIQRQVPFVPGQGAQRDVFPRLHKVVSTPRLHEKPGTDPGGASLVGIYGHRNQTIQRGVGDPTDWPFERLVDAGYEAMDMMHGGDIDTWRVRQAQLGIGVDGIAGPATVAALEHAGHAHGLWASRPGD